MNCLKCGRETAEDQVFCQNCLEEMEAYPVKPGTVVHIPTRTKEEEVRKPPHRRKPVLPVSEQIARLKKKLLWARIVLALLLLVCGLLCFAVGRAAIEWEEDQAIGQNYSIVDSYGNVTAP